MSSSEVVGCCINSVILVGRAQTPSAESPLVDWSPMASVGLRGKKPRIPAGIRKNPECLPGSFRVGPQVDGTKTPRIARAKRGVLNACATTFQ